MQKALDPRKGRVGGSKIHGTGLPVLPSECITLHAHVVTLRLTVGNHAAFQAITNGRVGSPAIRAQALEIQTSRFRIDMSATQH